MDRIESTAESMQAKARAAITASMTVGNAAAMREALQSVAAICDGAGTGGLDERTAIYNIARAALSAPATKKEGGTK